jgi:hypothetical protein
VDALVEQRLGRLEEGSGEHYHGGCAVASLNILGLGNFDKLGGERGTILAVGCTTSNFWRMVAPSLVMRVSPRPSLIILSMPRGPRLVRMQSATAG